MFWENEAILEESADDVIQRFVVPEGERMEFASRTLPRIAQADWFDAAWSVTGKFTSSTSREIRL